MKNRKYEEHNNCVGKCAFTLLVVLTFALAMSMLIVNGQWRNFYTSIEQPDLYQKRNHSGSSFRASSEELSSSKGFADGQLNAAKTVEERQTRAAGKNNSAQTARYYEEQPAVLVHAESQQPGFIGPPGGLESHEEYPYYNPSAGDAYESGEESPNYYEHHPAPEPVYRAEGRAAVTTVQQQKPYESYYNSGPWQSMPVSAAEKLQALSGARPLSAYTTNRPPYAAANYGNTLTDYDYAGRSQWHYPIQQQQQQQRQRTQQLVRSSSTTVKPVPDDGDGGENMLMTVLKGLKTLWDIYQAFAAAWNAIADHQSKQQLQQLPATRLNSRKPPEFVEQMKNGRNTTSTPNKNNNTNSNNQHPNKHQPKKPPPSKATTTERPIATKVVQSVVREETRQRGNKGDVTAKSTTHGQREKRTMDDSGTTDVGEGRYIKGDPLKGYYDFVITEGSYKFWAVFQVGTALLIIYSTFAAIYYSKVNPLVSDYDYTDYLGGARSLSGGDLDFVDDGEDTTKTTARPLTQRVLQEWLPHMGHSMKFILEAIDKLPGEASGAQREDDIALQTHADDEADYTAK